MNVPLKKEYTYTQTEGRKPKPWEHTHIHSLYLLMYMRVCAMKNTQPHRGQLRKTVLESQSNTTFYRPQQVTRRLLDLVVGTTIQQHKNTVVMVFPEGGGTKDDERVEACCIGPLNDQQAKVPTVWRPNCHRRLNQNVSKKQKWWAGEITCAHSRILEKGFKMEDI